jgi:beta-galactosidase
MSRSPTIPKRPIAPPIMRSVRPQPTSPGRISMSLNQGWLFRRGSPDEAEPTAPDHSWEPANLPHSARLEPLNASGGRNFQGICWYSRDLQLSNSWTDRILYLHFEGAMQVADVWLNGKKIATHYGGYTPFTIDITPYVTFDSAPNSLIVRLDNRDNPQVPPGKPQRELDFTYFAGLYRNVSLQVMDRLHIADPILADRVAGGGIFVTYPKVTSESATVQIRTDITSSHNHPIQCTVRQELLDAAGNSVATAQADQLIAPGASAIFSHTLELSNPNLWHPHHPHLYTLTTTVSDQSRLTDHQSTKIGIRHIRFDKNDGLLINGEKFFSIGANRHQDHPYVGYALPDSAHWRDVKKMREAGFTSFRSHYPQAPAFMDAADQLGLLTIVSNPGWQFVGDEIFQKRAIHNARLMVRRDRNRPSVILWEAALNESENGDLFATLQRAIHEEYPGDQCFTAGDREPNATTCWDVEYLHNNGDKPYWIREWGDHVDNWSDQQSSNRAARSWGESPMLIQAESHTKRMNQLMTGHQGSSSGPGARRLAGACLWAAIDCQRGYHHQPFFGGVFDAFRLPKFNHYLFQSQRPAHIHVNGLNDGPMVFIANFATLLSPTTVTVFSNCDQVRLLHNGTLIAQQKPDAGHQIAYPPFTFDVGPLRQEKSTMYMTGLENVHTVPVELKAEGLINGQIVATHIVRPPGVAKKLTLEADLCGWDLIADGSDWIRIHANVCDARGTLCPHADDSITFSVEGEARLIGGPEIGANPAQAQAGIATAILQATDTPGKIKITATTFGLAPATLEIQSHGASGKWLDGRVVNVVR